MYREVFHPYVFGDNDTVTVEKQKMYLNVDNELLKAVYGPGYVLLGLYMCSPDWIKFQSMCNDAAIKAIENSKYRDLGYNGKDLPDHSIIICELYRLMRGVKSVPTKDYPVFSSKFSLPVDYDPKTRQMRILGSEPFHLYFRKKNDTMEIRDPFFDICSGTIWKDVAPRFITKDPKYDSSITNDIMYDRESYLSKFELSLIKAVNRAIDMFTIDDE